MTNSTGDGSTLRAYAHCAKDVVGAVALLLINIDPDAAVDVELPAYDDSQPAIVSVTVVFHDTTNASLSPNNTCLAKACWVRLITLATVLLQQQDCFQTHTSNGNHSDDLRLGLWCELCMNGSHDLLNNFYGFCLYWTSTHALV